MTNILTDFGTRLKIDYQEWRTEWITRWNTYREMKRLDSAIRRGKERNARDHKTYFIIKDARGAINAMTGSDIDFWTKQGLFPKMNYYEKLRCSIDIVTSSRRTMNQFTYAKTNSKPK
jgi:hypothetical protein